MIGWILFVIVVLCYAHVFSSINNCAKYLKQLVDGQTTQAEELRAAVVALRTMAARGPTRGEVRAKAPAKEFRRNRQRRQQSTPISTRRSPRDLKGNARPLR